MNDGHASWYCHECSTYGGGRPNEMSMTAHMEYAHDGDIVEMERVRKT